MIIIGVDFHPEFQQIAMVDTETGELQERRLRHPNEAESFYQELVSRSTQVRVGMEASGHGRWFERLMGVLQIELWIGDAAEIRTKRVRKQKTDRQDAQLILKLMLKDDFPKIWVPSWENRDLRQLLWHRHRMVQARTRIMNQLQAVALNEGLRCKKRLWRTERQQLESFQLAPWASRRRRDLLELLDRLNPTIAQLSQAVEQEVERSAGGTTAGDPSWCRSPHRAGFRADHREGGTLSMWEAGGQLSRSGSNGRLQRQSPTVGTYHQARQFDIALPAGGGGAGNRAQSSGMA